MTCAPYPRTYLAVPYHDRLEAKRAGARWDADRKAWYAPELTEALQRWLPAPPTSLAPEADPRSDFAAVMLSVGLSVPEGHPIADGVRHRVPTQDDRRGRRSGFYVLHIDGLPAGFVLNHQTGESQRWHAKVQMSEEEKAHLRAHAAAQSALRERALAEQHAQVARDCQAELERCTTLQRGDWTPYLLDKGVTAHAGIHASIDGKTTHVPLRDIDGQLTSMQTIDVQGNKCFADGGRVKGCFHALGGHAQLEHAARNGVVVLSEGYATAASVATLLDEAPVPIASVATFYAHNLQPVAEILKTRYPHARLVIAGDDDRTKQRNSGRLCATEAARAVGAPVVFPPFTEGHPLKLSDWNDIDQYRLTGYDRATHRKTLRQAVARTLTAQRAIETPHRPSSEQAQSPAQQASPQQARPMRCRR